MGSEHRNPIASEIAPARHALPPGVTDAEVRRQLEQIRTSPPFRSSRRCVVFLDFVIHAALAGHLESLKERTIGVEVFSRDPSYDTNQDPVVRGTAGEVRKRLAQYYQIPGHERELRIDLPAGSYMPEFHFPAEVPATPRAANSNSSHKLWVTLTGLALLAAVTAVALFISRVYHKAPTVVDQFWAPILQSPGPVLLCVGQPKVYNLLGALQAEVSDVLPAPGRRLGADVANRKITAALAEFVPNWDRYVAIGDAMCLSDMAGLLAQRGRGYHIRGGGSTTFADLRENPTVLIGAFTNDWTMRLTGQLRFTFEQSSDRRCHYVHDRLHPGNRDWQLTNVWPEWKMPTDYALVSRVLDLTTGRVVVTAAGVTQYGTAAAGEFLTNPEYLSQAIRQAPRDWQHKNVQVVLETKVIDGTAGPPHVLATHFW